MEAYGFVTSLKIFRQFLSAIPFYVLQSHQADHQTDIHIFDNNARKQLYFLLKSFMVRMAATRRRTGLKIQR